MILCCWLVKKKNVCLLRYNINDIFIRMNMIIEYEFYIFENVKFVLCMEIDVGKYIVWIRVYLVYSLFVIY